MSPRKNRAELPPGSASQLLMEWAPHFSSNLPILDAGCGVGRNAVALARLGHKVICADSDVDRLRSLARIISRKRSRTSLFPVCVNLGHDEWPFGKDCFSAVVCVHFFDPKLLPLMRASLCAGGYLFIETIGGHGSNHLELPRAGELRQALDADFRFEFYEERQAGPERFGKRAVRLLAQKIS
jgi:SAM-dependent methyltransferase